jgi:hypothetical protein
MRPLREETSFFLFPVNGKFVVSGETIMHHLLKLEAVFYYL